MTGSRTLRTCLAACALASLAGCQSFFGYRGWPFPERDRTSFHTPSMRIDTVKQVARRSDGTDSSEQRELTDQLARQIQIEPDPLVRVAILRAVGEFRTPLSGQILAAGLQDENAAVRVAACQSLGERGEASAVANLAAALRDDAEMDVRIAAAEALGKIKDPAAIAAVAVALEDRDPALQFVGVQSMKSITGKDYGNNVDTWLQVAAGQTPQEPAVPSIAERIRSASPF